MSIVESTEVDEIIAIAFTVVVSVRVMGSSYSRLWSVGVLPSTV